MDAEEPKATLYDFAYIDQERTRSLTSQLFSGFNTSTQKNKTELSSNTTTGKVDAVVVGGAHTFRSEGVESDTKIFEPHDLSHLDLVAGLRDSGYLKEDPTEYRLGDIILVSGQLSLVNFDVVAPITRLLAEGQSDNTQGINRKERRASQKQPQAPASKPREADILRAVPDIVPLTVQLYLKNATHLIWGLIEGSGSREPISNIVLKYGPGIPGLWHLLALVDVVEDEEQKFDFLPKVALQLSESSRAMRPLFGRPKNCIGVTPLLLFRKLSHNHKAKP